MSGPSDLLLHFTSTDYSSPLGDGRPWGDGTEMASRADPAHPRDPWDAGCTVTPIIGGFAAMNEYRTTLDAVIAAAEAAATPAFANGAWQRGHVYLVDWRFNCLRDLSTNTDPWANPPADAAEDATAIGLVRRLMQAGVQVRMMLWLPTATAGASWAAGMGAHIEDHRYAAALVEEENRRLMPKFGAPAGSDPLGVVALDMRTAQARDSGSMHQKMMLVRTPTLDIAFAGGVDLAYTRRDAPLTYGDWQSGNNMPLPSPSWPRAIGATPDRYASVATATPRPSSRQGSDLPIDDGAGHRLFGPRQSWHDQHLKLTGPIVATLEHQFGERWRDTANYYAMQTDPGNRSSGQVIFSTAGAFIEGKPRTTRPLPPVNPVPPTGTSTVQMWRTIPWRNARTAPPFQRAEFTVLAGVANAVENAGQLIWIFDQYFWSRSLAVQLHQRLQNNSDLRVIIVLPPHADDPSTAPKQHQARFDALSLLMTASGQNVSDRVAVCSMWDPNPPDKTGRGIYVHAKVQLYDGNLLVCGSANLNRRSLLCDAELAVAVADPAVVAGHQQQLWNYLFPAGPAWPAPDFTKAGSGAAFFDAFNKAIGATGVGTAGASRLIRDPWNVDGNVLPGGARRVRSGPGWVYNSYYDKLIDPTSLDESCEAHAPDDNNHSNWASLRDVTYSLEQVFTPAKGKKPASYPFRKQG